MSSTRGYLGSTLLLSSLALAGCFYDTSGDAVVIDAGSPDSGMGSECTANGSECDGLEADFCLYNPTDTAENPAGECTLTGCVADSSIDCGSTHTCCDCTNSTMIPDSFKTDFCAPDAYVSMLPAAGCTCE